MQIAQCRSKRKRIFPLVLFNPSWRHTLQLRSASSNLNASRIHGNRRYADFTLPGESMYPLGSPTNDGACRTPRPAFYFSWHGVPFMSISASPFENCALIHIRFGRTHSTSAYRAKFMLIRLPLLTRHPSICAQIAPKFCFQLWALSMKREPRNEKTQYDHFTLMVQGLDFGLNRLIDGDLQNSLFDDRSRISK